MVAVPLARAPLPVLASQVHNSAILPVVSRVMPGPVRAVYASFANSIDSGDVPALFAPLAATRLPVVAAPDPALVNLPAVRAARQSIWKINGLAPACNLGLVGTGFAVSPHHLLTNAHVVAAVTQDLQAVSADGNQHLDAEVVAFDPERDLAVLYVPELSAPPLVFQKNAANGAGAIAIGYPADGPYTPVPARIRDRQVVPEPDIYRRTNVMREIYPLRTRVVPGNSGGPLLAPNGQVFGVVFAASPQDPDTGFALTANEAAPVVAAAKALTVPVSTGECARR
jgi:S1-C subfamily serine protease